METIKKFLPVAKNVLFTVLVIGYIIFTLPFALFALLYFSYILLHAIFAGKLFDLQIIFLCLLTAILLPGFWILLFIKIKMRYKILIFIFLIFLQICYVVSLEKLPVVKKIVNDIYLIDKGEVPKD